MKFPQITKKEDREDKNPDMTENLLKFSQQMRQEADDTNKQAMTSDRERDSVIFKSGELRGIDSLKVKNCFNEKANTVTTFI